METSSLAPSGVSPLADMTLRDFAASMYLPHVRARKQSWPTDERIISQYLCPTFGDRLLTSLGRREVETWLLSLARNDSDRDALAPATCNRILSVLKSLCNLAARRGLLPGGSPCAGLAPFPAHISRERRLSFQEAQRLMAALEASPRREALALRLLLLTGARKNEILRARWENVHLDEREIVVPEARGSRRIPLSAEAAEVVRLVPREEGCDWLFPGRSPDKPLSDLFLFWKEIRRELELDDVHIQDLRRSFVAFQLSEGRSLYAVRGLLCSRVRPGGMEQAWTSSAVA